MNDFDKQFDKQVTRIGTLAVFGFIFSSIVTLSVLGFIGWVVVKLLIHFGIC
jgi:hypothetical protein